MKLEILDLAKEDLIKGYRFHEIQESGLRSYFLDTLYSDIDSLRIYSGIHRKAYNNLHRACRSVFRSRYTTPLNRRRSG